jgi:hypothetical protein
VDFNPDDVDRILVRLNKRDRELFDLEMSAKRTALRATRLTETIRCRKAVAALRQKRGIGVLLKTVDDWALVEGRTVAAAQAAADRLVRERSDIASDLFHGDGTRTIIGA